MSVCASTAVYLVVGDLDGCGRAVRLLVQVDATRGLRDYAKGQDEAPRKHPAHGVVHLRRHPIMSPEKRPAQGVVHLLKDTL